MEYSKIPNNPNSLNLIENETENQIKKEIKYHKPINNQKIFIYLIIIIVSFLIFIYLKISSNSTTTLNKAYKKEDNEENAKLNKEKSILLEERDRLKQERDQLINKTYILVEKNEKLKEEKEKLNLDKIEIIREKGQLKLENDKIMIEKNILLKERDEIIKEKDKLMKENSKLFEERDELIEQKNNLTEQKNKLLEEKNKLIELKNKLVEEKTQLIMEKNESNFEQEELTEEKIPLPQDVYKIEIFNSRKKSFKKAKSFLKACINEEITQKINSTFNETPIATAVIPVYNSKSRISKAIKSIQNQNIINIEIILVNDKSTDGTLSFIKEIQKNDSRIKIIENKKNMGIIYSRCIGTLSAKGKYIFPLDNDDMFLDADVFQTITSIAEKGNFDIVEFKGIESKIRNKDILNNKIRDTSWCGHPLNLVLYQPQLGCYQTWPTDSLTKYRVESMYLHSRTEPLDTHTLSAHETRL